MRTRDKCIRRMPRDTEIVNRCVFFVLEINKIFDFFSCTQFTWENGWMRCLHCARILRLTCLATACLQEMNERRKRMDVERMFVYTMKFCYKLCWKYSCQIVLAGFCIGIKFSASDRVRIDNWNNAFTNQQRICPRSNSHTCMLSLAYINRSIVMLIYTSKIRLWWGARKTIILYFDKNTDSKSHTNTHKWLVEWIQVLCSIVYTLTSQMVSNGIADYLFILLISTRRTQLGYSSSSKWLEMAHMAKFTKWVASWFSANENPIERKRKWNVWFRFCRDDTPKLVNWPQSKWWMWPKMRRRKSN